MELKDDSVFPPLKQWFSRDRKIVFSRYQTNNTSVIPNVVCRSVCIYMAPSLVKVLSSYTCVI